MKSGSNENLPRERAEKLHTRREFLTWTALACGAVCLVGMYPGEGRKDTHLQLHAFRARPGHKIPVSLSLQRRHFAEETLVYPVLLDDHRKVIHTLSPISLERENPRELRGTVVAPEHPAQGESYQLALVYRSSLGAMIYSNTSEVVCTSFYAGL